MKPLTAQFQDLGERRSLRLTVEEDARGSLREMRLREEVAGWVREVLKRVEGREGGQREEGGALRRLVRRRSKRETRAVWSEIRHGALRRSNSMEQLAEQVVFNSQ